MAATQSNNQDKISLGAATADSCFHCGESIISNAITYDAKAFCCAGCSTVYQVLNKHGLCDYYQYTEHPGINQRVPVRPEKFAFLEDEQIIKQLLVFENEHQAQVVFYLPQMHCSSCLWLLEHLQSIHSGMISSRVDFPNKEVVILYQQQEITLRKIAEILSSIGYEPYISLSDIGKKPKKYYNRQRTYRVGVAGFCFSNIMLLSFPEYFGLEGLTEAFDLQAVFQWLILGLSLPVFFYSANEFFSSGWKGLRHRFLNIDAPIALAIFITFLRSVYEILSGTGPGYFDSMSGIVFFMLAGRILQDRTQQSLSFDRDYTSYFPIAINKLEDGREKPVPLPQLKNGDSIIIHSNEIIPADGILVRGQAIIDYSFVTGESKAVEKNISEIIYAGGKQTGGNIELLLVKDVSQSYLTSLWNKESMRREENNNDSFVHNWSKWFTVVLFSIAMSAASWWYVHDASKIWPAVTAILIVACPCALLLSNNFTNGHVIRLFDRAGFYVRNAAVVERMCRINHIVFDKTGTLTNTDQFIVKSFGDPLQKEDKLLIATLARQSNHPLSRIIASHLRQEQTMAIDSFKETPGKGCEAWMNDQHVVLGSADYVWNKPGAKVTGTLVAFRIDKRLNGFFVISNQYRPGVSRLMKSLVTGFGLSVISGDNDEERHRLQQWTGEHADLLFNQKPSDKLAYIEALQNKHDAVMMVGDGLNDAGALKESLVGIAVTNNINNFSPACDAIMEAAQLTALPQYLRLARNARTVITMSFIISICYNIIGLSYAVQGTLSPLIAAILMPASSISIVVFTWLAVQLSGRPLLKTMEKHNKGH